MVQNTEKTDIEALEMLAAGEPSLTSIHPISDVLTYDNPERDTGLATLKAQFKKRLENDGDEPDTHSESSSADGGEDEQGTPEEINERQPYDPSYASKRLKDWSPPSKSEPIREGHGNRYMPSKRLVSVRIGSEFEQLLRELDEWGELRTRISETYIRLGLQCNNAVAAFGCSDSDLSELHTVPEELRAVLEICLAEDAIPEDVERHRSALRDMRDKLREALQKRCQVQPEGDVPQKEAPSNYGGFEPPVNQTNGGRLVQLVSGKPRPRPRP
ncbi:hypothetical protein ONZ45_g12459 [Pleurotus djamor]|nr:hypothetical protein ONZ45_g12459 [Pleurotus djamor]